MICTEQAKSLFDQFTKEIFSFYFIPSIPLFALSFLHNLIIINNFIARYSSSLGINSVIN